VMSSDSTASAGHHAERDRIGILICP
jgi:hypothetical protein